MSEIEIEAFRADTKASKGLTAAHIAEAASLYDAEKNPAPLVFGHPTNDSPALGIVSKARVDGNKLFLTMKNIAEDLKKAVRESRVINRSIAFWDPDHPSNPHPGKYSLRHLGFLGGMAPAIPGMGRLRFSADEGEIETDEAPADAVIFAVDDKPTGTQRITEPKPGEKEPKMEFTAEQIAELKAKAARADAAEAERDQLKADQEKRDREFAAAEKTRRDAEDAAALTTAVEAGKVLPAEKDDLAKLFEALPTKALTFSAGELEPRVALAKFLDGLPKRGPAKDEAPKSPTGEFNADDNTNKKKADEALAAHNAGLSGAWKPQQPTAH
jgi:hypothetical protein